MNENPFDIPYHFDAKRDCAVFADGVEYSSSEMVHLSRTGLSREDAPALHLVKKIFDGEVIVPGINDTPPLARMHPTWRADQSYPSITSMLESLRQYPQEPKVYHFRKRKRDVAPDAVQQELPL